MTQKATLSAGVSFAGKGTHVTIRMGGLIVATARLGGRWNEVNAVKEFARFPNRFQFAPKFSGLTPEMIRSLVK